jgi:hypothetical protein
MSISLRASVLSATFIASAAMFAATPAYAQATRTWVAGRGDDANPCSRTAPCRTFAGAISKTAAGGEINCVEPGDFQAVTITKSMAIICDTNGAGVSALSANNGIVVNAGPTDVVYLSGLNINGFGSAQNGVRFIAGAALHIEHSVIRGANASGGWGVLFQPSGSAQLKINDSVIADNGAGGTSGGVQIAPTGTGSANVELRDVRLQNNNGAGLRVDSTGNTGAGITVSLDHVQSVGNQQGIAVLNPPTTTTIGLMIANSTFDLNSAVGIFVNGGAATARVGNTTISGNALGVASLGGSTLASYGDNRLDGNPMATAANNGTFGGVTPKK